MRTPGRLLLAGWTALALFGPRPALALDPERPLSQVQVDVWQMEHGLPQNTVTALLRTRDGRLWFGTSEGLVRFDGAVFTVFDGKSSPFLAEGQTISLMEDRRGGLWVGRGDNVVRYEDGIFRQVIGPSDIGQGTVWSLCEGPDGTVWAAATRGLVRWRNGKAALLTKRDGLPVDRLRSVAFDRDGTLWIGTNGGGLVAMREGRFTTWSTANGLRDDSVIAVLPDPAGGVWASTAGGGLVRAHGETVRSFGKADGLPTEQLTALSLDREGSLWIGTWGSGICRLRNGSFTALPGSALSNDKIWSILADPEGFVWVGTWVGGLNRLRDRMFPVYGVPEGLSNDNVRAVLHGRDGSVWIATAGGGVNRLRDGSVEVLRAADGLPADEVSALHEDPSGNLWIGTYTGGLARRSPDGHIDLFGRAEGLPGHDVRAIHVDRRATVWVATTFGVCRSRDGRTFEKLNPPDGVLLTGVVALLEDRAGTFWFGTSMDGLVRYDGSAFRVLTTRDGLLSDRISALLEDGEGTLWIGNLWNGINRLKNGKLAAIRTADGLADGRIQVLLQDRSGGIWTTGNKGFQRLWKRELEAVADGGRGPVHPLSFGIADGLRSATFANGQQPAGSVGPDGRLWLPSHRGVVVVDPARIPSPPAPPGVRIEEFLVDGTRVAAGESARIEPGRRRLEIRYAPTTLRSPESIRFRVRLEGFEESWVEVGTRRAAYYTGLPPGGYRFLAASRVGEGHWGPDEALLSLTVLPAFHESLWFRLSAALLVVASTLAVVRIRTVKLKRRQAELERLVAERTEALQRANVQLTEMSLTDSLSGLANRRRFDEGVESEWKRGVRFGNPLSVILADIDFFKRYNDSFGHPAGDRCIAEVGGALRQVAQRAGDVVARYGGEEFVLLLPATTLDKAELLAEVARAKVEALRLPHPDGPSPFVTLSFGVAAVVPSVSGDHRALVAAADEALYRAKRKGRNRIEVSDPLSSGVWRLATADPPPDDPST